MQFDYHNTKHIFLVIILTLVGSFVSSLATSITTIYFASVEDRETHFL